MKFHKHEFLEYMENNFVMDRFARDLLGSIIEYGEEHNNITKYQIVYFIYDILKEVDVIDYEEVEQFYK